MSLLRTDRDDPTEDGADNRPIEATNTAALPMSSELPKWGSLSPVMALAIDSRALLNISAVNTPAIQMARMHHSVNSTRRATPATTTSRADGQVEAEAALAADPTATPRKASRNLRNQERWMKLGSLGMSLF